MPRRVADVSLSKAVYLFRARAPGGAGRGPNDTDYVWIDSNAPDPVITFDWVDATGGTITSSTDCDDCADTVSLPFTFNFFDTDYTELDIGTNGLISFNTGDSCNENHNWGPPPDFVGGNAIPHGDADCEDDGWGANPLIAPWFDDLDPSIPANFGCGDVYYDTLGSAPNRQFVVQFDDVCHDTCFPDCAAGQGVTFETILFEGSNDIKVQYLDTFFDANLNTENNGGSATTGINLDGSTGLQYSFNQTVLTDGLAVLYTTQPPTPTATPTATATPTSTPAPTVLAATATPAPTPTVLAVQQLPATGGTPSDGGSGALPWLAAIAGAIALIGSGSAWFAYQRRRIR